MGSSPDPPEQQQPLGGEPAPGPALQAGAAGDGAAAAAQQPPPPQPRYVDAAVQTFERADAAVQCEAPPPPAPGDAELRAQLGSAALARFLCRAVPVAEQALQQNELVDALRDEFAGGCFSTGGVSLSAHLL